MLSPVGAAIVGLAAAPLHAAAPASMSIGVCGQPGMTLRIPFAPGKWPVRGDGMGGCHSCALRKRSGDACLCGDDAPV